MKPKKTKDCPPKQKAPQKPKASEDKALEKTAGRKPMSRRLMADDIDNVAELVARGMNEAQAVSLACPNVSIDSWKNWKCINKDTFYDKLTRLKAARVSSLLAQVETHADIGKAQEKQLRPDWRAAQWLLSITAPSEFAKQSDTGQAPAVSITCTLAPELVRAVFQDCQTVDVETIPAASEPKRIGASDTPSDAAQA